MKKIKLVIKIIALYLTGAASVFVAVTGVAMTLDAIVSGLDFAYVIGPVSTTILFSYLAAMCVAKGLSAIEETSGDE